MADKNYDENNENAMEKIPLRDSNAVRAGEPAYKDWEGKNSFLCRGNLIVGSQPQNLCYTLLLISLPLGISLGVTVPNFYDAADRFYPIVLLPALYVITISFCLMTSFMDPGIIPRPDALHSEAREWNPNLVPQNYMESNLNMGGTMKNLKFCQTCMIFRPPRSFHCRLCDNCVERFDHHCPYLGTCIGRRNYGYFSIFLTLLITLAVSVMVISLDYLIWVFNYKYKKKWIEVGKHEWVTSVLALYYIIAVAFLLSLSAFHIRLLLNGRTTAEQLRENYKFGSPYRKSICHLHQGCYEVCCTVPQSNLAIKNERPVLGTQEYRAGERTIKVLKEAHEDDWRRLSYVQYRNGYGDTKGKHHFELQPLKGMPPEVYPRNNQFVSNHHEREGLRDACRSNTKATYKNSVDQYEQYRGVNLERAQQCSLLQRDAGMNVGTVVRAVS